MAMRRRYHSELENASQLIREQQEVSEAMANHYRQDGLQLREACAQYVNEKEMANKEEMEILKQKLVESSQMMVVNNEMVMEHGQQAVALRDGQLAENAINYQRVDGKSDEERTTSLPPRTVRRVIISRKFVTWRTWLRRRMTSTFGGTMSYRWRSITS